VPTLGELTEDKGSVMQAEPKGQVNEELRITNHVLHVKETVIGELESSGKLGYP